MTKIIPFYLDHDKAEARVKFIEKPKLEIHGFPCHVYKEDQTIKYAPCRVDCPYCEQGDKVQVKVFIPLWDIQDKCVKFWERAYFGYHELDYTLGQIPYDELDLKTQVFKIVRHGERFNPATKYEITREKEKDTYTDYGDIPTALEVFTALYGDK